MHPVSYPISFSPGRYLESMNAPPAAPNVTVIETCWPVIEVFVDLETSVAVAQTCHSLHKAIIEPLTKKVKVSHFSTSAPKRIPHYLPRSLNSIHFPSLQNLHLSFPRTKCRKSSHADDVDDACYSSFPIFVANLSSAYNLKRLFLNADRLMVRHDKAIHLEALYEIFAENLRRCTKLRDLGVNNAGVVSGYNESFYSVALLQAITGAVQLGTNKLDAIKIIIGGKPSDILYNQHLRSNGIDPVFDFFRAALTTKSLKLLSISLAPQHWDSLNNCSEFLSSGDGARPKYLKELYLSMDWINSDIIRHQSDSAHHLLYLFSECNSLESIYLNIPTLGWEDERNTQALRKLLKHKHCLSKVSISVFGESSSMLSVLLDCLSPNIEAKILHKISILGLSDVDRNYCIQLQSSLKTSGMVCEQFQVKINERGNWDIARMNNRRLMEGESVADSFDHFLAAKYPNTL